MPFLKVLVAVEGPLCRNLLKSSLTSWGCRVVEAIHTESTRAALLGGNIDLCLLDWCTANIDGREICRWARSLALDPAPHFIMIAEECSPAQLQAAYIAGANDFLPRPFDIEDLKARFAKLSSRVLAVESVRKEVSRLDPVERYRRDLINCAKVS